MNYKKLCFNYKIIKRFIKLNDGTSKILYHL
jgi:hypothetical protein